jgi:hypothetical protein
MSRMRNGTRTIFFLFQHMSRYVLYKGYENNKRTIIDKDTSRCCSHQMRCTTQISTWIALVASFVSSLLIAHFTFGR